MRIFFLCVLMLAAALVGAYPVSLAELMTAIGRRLTGAAPVGQIDTVLFEVRLGPASPLAGRTLREAGLPPNTLVVSVVHEGEILFPRATTRLAVGDVVQIMDEPAGEAALRRFLAGDAAPAA